MQSGRTGRRRARVRHRHRCRARHAGAGADHAVEHRARARRVDGDRNRVRPVAGGASVAARSGRGLALRVRRPCGNTSQSRSRPVAPTSCARR